MNWKALGIEIDFSLPIERVVWAMEHIIECRAKPQQNAYVDQINCTVPHEWLFQYYWEDLEEV